MTVFKSVAEFDAEIHRGGGTPILSQHQFEIYMANRLNGWDRYTALQMVLTGNTDTAYIRWSSGDEKLVLDDDERNIFQERIDRECESSYTDVGELDEDIELIRNR